MKPILFLDVDGPLNPYGAKPHQRPEGYDTHRLKPTNWVGKPLRVWLNPSHGKMLLDLADRASLDLVWATTWQQDANTMIGPRVGLPILPVVEFNLESSLWKWPAVADYANGKPFAWLDDDFSYYRHVSLPFTVARVGIPTLLHDVNPAIGLTEKDIAEVEKWAKRLRVNSDKQEEVPSASETCRATST